MPTKAVKKGKYTATATWKIGGSTSKASAAVNVTSYSQPVQRRVYKTIEVK